MEIFEFLKDIKIDEPDKAIYAAAKEKWDGVSKPIDGLGDFETLICRIAAIRRQLCPEVTKRTAVIMCADNGIVEEGISQSGKEITKAVAEALGNSISSACSIGRAVKADVIAVDIGIDTEDEIKGVRNLKVARGTRNFLKEPAMTEEETIRAISAGIKLAEELSKEGVDMLATGEMGIGNTTTSAAVLTALLRAEPDEFVGRGAGLSDEGLCRKKEVIKRALSKYSFEAAKSEAERFFWILRTLGGLDIAGLVGVYIGAAKSHVPVVIDGVISSTAALLAEKLVPGTVDYMLPSHSGREKGNLAALSALGLRPYINGNMALGEGTGALMLFPLLDVVMDYYKNGASFEDYEIESYERFN